MKSVKFAAIAAVIAMPILFAAFTNHPGITAPVPAPEGPAGFALLELYTSEGCSSCPAADELLARVQQEAAGKPVYLLSYHVDYWNRLGWKDSFSQASFSERQYQYSRWLSGQVYTPQLVINGKKECVGSDEGAVSDGIRDALAVRPDVNLSLELRQTGGQASVEYTAKGELAGSRLFIAVVRKHAVSKVTAGENNHRTLVHAQIVERLMNFPVLAAGSEKVGLPANWNAADWEIIGFVQDTRNGQIRGAARAK